MWLISLTDYSKAKKMAKVKELKFEIDGVEHSCNVNVNKDGFFKVVLPLAIAEKLGIDSRLESMKLQDIEKIIFPAVSQYRESSKIHSLHIVVRYGASGVYSFEDISNNRFRISRMHDDIPSVGLTYDIVIKELISTSGVVNWFHSFKLHENLLKKIEEGANIRHVQGYEFGRSIYREPSGVIVPYSKEAVETLDKAIEGIKGISGIIYNVVSKSPEQVEKALITSKLLS